MPPKPTSSKRKIESPSPSSAAAAAEDSPLSDPPASDEDDKPKKKRAKKAKDPVVPLDPNLPTNLTVPDPLEPFARPAEGAVRVSAFNVAGLRASEKKGFSRYVEAEDADILIVTETKTPEIKLDSLDSRYEYRYWGDSKKKGQAGTAVFSKIKPLDVVYGIPGDARDIFHEDSAGRCVALEFKTCYMVGTYVPNAGAALKTMPEKKAWNAAFERYLRELDGKKPVIWCGDLNVVATEKDIRNWKTNYNKSAGCTDDEIAGFNSQLNPPEDSGHEKLVDVWRHQNPEQEGHYSYYSYKFKCREKGIGWRLDYVVVSERLLSKVKACEMRQEIWGASDHIPLILDIEGPL
ncbi:hypothetical protein JCM8547_004590 [Rhodosporidiobolus lusitaniae]